MDDTSRNAPATKGDVQDAIKTAKDELIEAIRDSETKLLSAFYGYAKSNDKRVLETEPTNPFCGTVWQRSNRV
jgi:hypothetical protein